jgi:hypothetical protein
MYSRLICKLTINIAWRASLAGQIYFVPDFDETQGYYSAASGWWDYWGSNVEALFSWDSAWPAGVAGSQFEGDISPDLNVQAGAIAHKKGYMMGKLFFTCRTATELTNPLAVSSLQYKNAVGRLWTFVNQPSLTRSV